PCVGNTTKDDYRTTIDKSVLFLEGRYETLARDTRKEMQQASDALAFERAATLRDRLAAIERTLDRQEVHAYKGDDFDVLGAAVRSGCSCRSGARSATSRSSRRVTPRTRSSRSGSVGSPTVARPTPRSASSRRRSGSTARRSGSSATT